MINWKSPNLILIVSMINENQRNIIHYSRIKSYLLANGLINLNYTVCFLTNKKTIEKQSNYFYINHELLTVEKLACFKFIFSTLHNKETLTPLFKANVFNKILKAKQLNKNLTVVNRTCGYPEVLNQLGIDSYKFFDHIFLQTENMNIPNFISRNVLGRNDKLSVKTFNQIFEKKFKKRSKFSFDEMTFNIEKNISNVNDMLSTNTINLLYLGRLMGGRGMDIIFLMKLMKRLGSKYKLYIIPGSFYLPNEKNGKKYSATHLPNIEKLRKFIHNYKLEFVEIPNYWKEQNLYPEDDDCQTCNIELLNQVEYKNLHSFISNFDIALGFSNTKNIKVPQGSAKCIDYMKSNLKIVYEDGWDNTKYIQQYNFGKVLSNNSTVNDFIHAIKDIVNSQKKTFYDKFISEHNCNIRAKNIINFIEEK